MGPALALLTVYTYAKSMDDKSAAAGIGSAGAGFAGHMDDLNPPLDYGPSDFSVKHRFVNSVVYSLPVGRGKRYLGNMNKAENALIGGWQVSAITTFQTGFPFSMAASDPGAYLSFRACAQIEIGNPNPVSGKNINQWFNTAAFSQPAFGVYGNTGQQHTHATGNQQLGRWNGQRHSSSPNGSVSSSAWKRSIPLTTRSMESIPSRRPLVARVKMRSMQRWGI